MYNNIYLMNILIADNDICLRNGLKAILSKLGHNVTTAKDGKEAVELNDNNKYDIIISEMIMPYLSGIELASIVRKKENNIIFIIVSNMYTDDIANDLLKFGIVNCIKKPFNIKELIEKINKPVIIEAKITNKKGIKKP